MRGPTKGLPSRGAVFSEPMEGMAENFFESTPRGIRFDQFPGRAVGTTHWTENVGNARIAKATRRPVTNERHVLGGIEAELLVQSPDDTAGQPLPKSVMELDPATVSMLPPPRTARKVVKMETKRFRNPARGDFGLDGFSRFKRRENVNLGMRGKRHCRTPADTGFGTMVGAAGIGGKKDSHVAEPVSCESGLLEEPSTGKPSFHHARKKWVAIRFSGGGGVM